jgi:hypothetical protein
MILSLAYALIGVSTRKMQGIHYSVVLLRYSIFAFSSILSIILIEAVITDQDIRIISVYSWK